MSKMRVAQVTRANGPLEIVEREIPEPGQGSVRIKIEACGICHSDSVTKEGIWPGIRFPRVPGHEIAGVIDAVGAGVAGWTEGQRVGVGWHGGHCGYCDSCRRGDFAIKAAIGLALGNLPEKCLAFDIDNCSVTRLDHLASHGHSSWRLPMVNQQPWIADASHNAMHQPAGPEVVPATKLA